MTFLRDSIIPMIYSEVIEANEDKPFDKLQEEINSRYEIVGTHYSKSIELPVLRLRYKGVEIVFRYNFYDYEVTVISESDLNLPKGLFNPEETSFYYQGFPAEYMLKTNYATSHKKFSVSITSSEYLFYTFMFVLKNEIDRIWDASK